MQAARGEARSSEIRSPPRILPRFLGHCSTCNPRDAWPRLSRSWRRLGQFAVIQVEHSESVGSLRGLNRICGLAARLKSGPSQKPA
jgi:hypothetical protein